MNQNIINLNVLTQKQKEAYLLRRQGLTLPQIARKLGISPTAAKFRLSGADRRLRDYEYYRLKQQKNKETVSLTVAYADLSILIESLRVIYDLMSAEMPGAEEQSLGYDRRHVKQLHYQLQKSCYGRVEHLLPNSLPDR